MPDNSVATGVAIHCNFSGDLGLAEEECDQVAVHDSESSLFAHDKTPLVFAVKSGIRDSNFSRGSVFKPQELGATEDQIPECVTVTALNNFADACQLGLGIEPDFGLPEALEPSEANFSGASLTPIQRDGAFHRPDTVEDVDAELVAQAQSGKLDAFEELVRRHTKLIYRTLMAILGNRTEAQDAMQDTLLNAFKHLRGFQARSKFSTWVVSIARNAALQRLRGRKNFESLDEGERDEDQHFRPHQLRAWQDNPEQCYSKTEVQRLVKTGILALPAILRVVVALRDIEQLSTNEVARRLGLSVTAVKTRLRRGRLKLREWLSPHFTANPRGAFNDNA